MTISPNISEHLSGSDNAQNEKNSSHSFSENQKRKQLEKGNIQEGTRTLSQDFRNEIRPDEMSTQERPEKHNKLLSKQDQEKQETRNTTHVQLSEYREILGDRFDKEI